MTNMITYLSEVLGGPLRDRSSHFCFVAFGSAGVFVNVASLWIESYQVYIYMNLCALLVALLFYLFLVESPFYFYHRRDVRGLYKSLLQICSHNFAEDEIPRVKALIELNLKNFHFTQPARREPEPESGSEPLPEHVLDMFEGDHKDSLHLLDETNEASYKEVCWTFLRLMIVFFQVEGTFYMGLVLNKNLGIPNVHISGMLLTLFQTLGFLAGLIFTHSVSRRRINISSSIVVCVLSAVILMVDLASNQRTQYASRYWGVRLAETGRLTSSGPLIAFPGLCPVRDRLYLLRRAF